MGVKNLIKRQKSAREKTKLPVKKWTKWPKMVFTGNFFFHGQKKKTLFTGAYFLFVMELLEGHFAECVICQEESNGWRAFEDDFE